MLVVLAFVLVMLVLKRDLDIDSGSNSIPNRLYIAVLFEKGRQKFVSVMCRL